MPNVATEYQPAMKNNQSCNYSANLPKQISKINEYQKVIIGRMT